MVAEKFEIDPAEDTLGGRISLCREAAGLTVEDAARRLGVLTKSWSAWECDRDVPRVNRLTMMAGLLGVSPCWLLAGVGAGPVPPATEENTDFLRVLRQTTEEAEALSRRMKNMEAILAKHASSWGC